MGDRADSAPSDTIRHVRVLQRRMERVGLDLRGKAHAGVITSIDHGAHRHESFDDFCRRQAVRVRERVNTHERRVQRRLATLADAIEPTWRLDAKGITQGMGRGPYGRVQQDGDT